MRKTEGFYELKEWERCGENRYSHRYPDSTAEEFEQYTTRASVAKTGEYDIELPAEVL